MRLTPDQSLSTLMNRAALFGAGPRQPLPFVAAAPGTVNWTTHPAAVAFNSYFPLPPGLLDCAAKEDITGTPFGFSFLGFRFSRLPFCSRLAIATSLVSAFD